MKRKKLLALTMAITMLVSTLLTACGESKEAIALTDKVLAQGTTVIDFSKNIDSSVIFESDGWTNGDVFNVVWTKSNVKYENNLLKLGITKEDKTAWLDDKEVTYHYTAGEARTQNYYGYGDYEVKMKPSANPGTASTFFVCTGPYDEKVTYNEDGTATTTKNPHDEIDIEFLGKDTTHVQFNFFVDGKGGNEYMYDLGFDASKEYHEYGFRWEKDSITWFVDDKPVYKVTTDKNAKTGENVRIVEKLPSTPGRMLANYWCGNAKAEGWMGKYSGNTKDNGCEYQWISTTAEGAPLNGPAPSNPGDEKPEIDWSTITAVAPTFGSTDLYTVVIDNNVANVKYDAIGGSSYLNVEMDIADAAASKNVLHLTLTNNGTTDAQVRVNVVDDALLSSGAQNASTNQSATLDGAEVYTDLVWGGSFFTIPAGKSAEAVIYFNGSVEKLQLMIDSSRNDANTYAGDVTVSDIKFAKEGEIVETPVDPNPEQPVDPVDPTPSGDVSTKIDGTEVTFDGNLTDGYTVNADDSNNTLNVTYTGITGNSYKNIWTAVSNLATGKNVFSVKITNNGTETVKVRIDIESNAALNANNKLACNLSATQDGVAVNTDLEWGGSMFEIPAGKTVVAEVTYDASKNPTNLKIFVDSHTYDDSAAHSGNVTFTEMTFKSEGTTGTPEQPAEPEKEYTFTAINKVMKIKSAVFVRNMPNKYGEKLGAVATGAEVYVYGKCNETGWYKIEYKGGVGYVSKGYVDESTGVTPDNPPVEPTPTPTPTPDPTPTPTPTPEPEKPATSGDLTTKIDGTEVTFDGNVQDGYIVNADDSKNTVNVTYEGMVGNSYKNIWANIGSIAATKNIFSVTITNNGATAVKVRIDIESATQVNANTTACNQSSTQDGVSTYTDLEWGGSMFEVPAGKTVVAEVTYDASKTPTNVKIFFDSHTYDDNNAHSGNVTLSNMTLKGEYTPGQKPQEPVTPTYDKLTFWGNEADGYTIDPNYQPTDTLNIKYTGAGNTYKCIGCDTAELKALANANNTFKLVITNNGTSATKVRVDVKGTKAAGNTDACNVSATGEGVWTDTDWGGTHVEVAAGATVTMTITYDNTMAQGAVTGILVFTGSQTGASDVTSTDITISAFEFSTK